MAAPQNEITANELPEDWGEVQGHDGVPLIWVDANEYKSLREHQRVTNEMLAAADHIGGYLDIARGTTWSIHSDHDSGWHYSIDDKIVASGKSMVEAFAAIREQQNEASTPSAAHSVNADGSCNLGCC